MSDLYKNTQYGKLSLIAYNTVLNRFKNYNSLTLSEASYERPFVLEDMIAPIRLLRNIGKGYVFELVNAYELSFGVSFPTPVGGRDLLLDSSLENTY
jgi:hypothetical protein